MSKANAPTSDFGLRPSDIFGVNIDTARPQGSTGMVEAVLALTYNPNIFDVSAADVQLGTVPEGGSGWKLQAEVNAQAGLIGVELFSTTPIQSTAGGSLVTIAMHVLNTAPAGTGLTLVPYVDPTGGPRVYQTSVADTQGEFVLHAAQTAAGTEPGAPGLVTIAAQTPNAGGSSLEQTAQVLQASALVQPGAILASESCDQTPSAIRDLDVMQAPVAMAKPDWLADDELVYWAQTAQRGLPTSAADLLDSAAPGPDGSDPAGLEAYFAGEGSQRRR